MTRHALENIDDVIRGLDPAPRTISQDERRRGAETLDRVIATGVVDDASTAPVRSPHRRGRALAAAGLATVMAIVAPTVLSGGSAFASWTSVPEPLTGSSAAAATTTCRSALNVDDDGLRSVIAEERGAWTYVLLQGANGEGACLMPDRLVKDAGTAPVGGYFSTFDGDPPEAPVPARDDIVETESMSGSVTVSERMFRRDVDGWFTWVNGYAGSEVTRVTVHPGVGPDVEATVRSGRFSAWWPAGESENPGAGEAWSYTLTLTDGSTRDVGADG